MFLDPTYKVYLDLLCSVGRILGAVTETIVSVVATKIQIIRTLSSSGVVAGAVEGAAKGGAVLVEEGPGLVSAGVNLASQLIKVGTNISVLEFRGGKPPLILIARFARTNVAEYVR